MTNGVHLLSFRLELSQLVLCEGQEVVIVFWVLLPAHGLQQPTAQLVSAQFTVCVCVRLTVIECDCVCVCVLPVLCLQGAGQVFGVGVTEGVGQTVLVDFLTVGFGLWGAAFTLKHTTRHS